MNRRVTMLLGAIILPLGTAAPAVASNNSSSPPANTIYRANAVSVSYRQLATGDPQWSKVPQKFRDSLPQGSYIAQLQIKNVSKRAISDWALTFELPETITATESAKLDPRLGERTTIQNDPANKVIQPGATSTVWYRARAGSAHTPAWATFAKDGALPTKDTDGDGLPDDIEQRAKLDPAVPGVRLLRRGC